MSACGCWTGCFDFLVSPPLAACGPANGHPAPARVPILTTPKTPKTPKTPITSIQNGAAASQYESEGDDPAVSDAFMRAAAASAIAGVKLLHGGPFGACVVKGGIVISCAHNTVLAHEDPTCHAEMNAVRDACQRLQSHDLSDCELYTTCEPCPMCWGAIQWSRLNKVYIGADRYTAAKYGFDDKVFYDEVEAHAETFGLHRYGYMQDSHALAQNGTFAMDIKQERVHKHMVEVHTGVLKDDCEQLFTGSMNKTYRRRLSAGKGLMKKVYADAFEGEQSPLTSKTSMTKPPNFPDITSESDQYELHETFMRRAVQVARTSALEGTSKEREPFAAVVVLGGQVIATGSNSVLQSRDATATAEVNAIRAAAKCLGTHVLE